MTGGGAAGARVSQPCERAFLAGLGVSARRPAAWEHLVSPGYFPLIIISSPQPAETVLVVYRACSCNHVIS